MSIPGEFLILRRGEPFLFGNALLGATWIHPLLFERPIERIGSDFELYWNGELYSSDKVHVVRILAHWKKITSKRARKLSVPLESVVDLNELSDEEIEELLVGVARD